MHFEIYRCAATDAASAPEKPWKWRLVGDDGAALAYGEGYRSSAECERILRLVQASNPDTPIRYG